MAFQTKQQSLYNMKKVRESIHNSIALQVFMKWKMLSDQAAQGESMKLQHETALSSLSEQSRQQISDLQHNLQSVEQSCKTQLAQLSSACDSRVRQNAVRQVSLLLQSQQRHQLIRAFYQWRDRSVSREMASKSEALQLEIQSLQAELNQVHSEAAVEK